MTQFLEDTSPLMSQGGFNSTKSGTLSGNIAFTGTNTHSGTETFSGALSVTGTLAGKKLSEVVSATNVISASESGTTFYLASATEFVSTLPAVALGLVFDFYVSAAPASASYTIVGASGTPIVGHVVTTDVNSGTDPSFNASGVLTITLVDGKAVKGDRVHIECDGTNYYATAYCSVFDAITFS